MTEGPLIYCKRSDGQDTIVLHTVLSFPSQDLFQNLDLEYLEASLSILAGPHDDCQLAYILCTHTKH